MSQSTQKSSSSPLQGVTVLVTRAERQAAGICQWLADRGADVLVQPAIEIAPPPDWGQVDDALTRLDEFDWLVFSSANGVDFLLERIRQLDRQTVAGDDDGHDLALHLVGVKLAAIGSGTAEELKKYGLQADVVPEVYRAEALADALIAAVSTDLRISGDIRATNGSPASAKENVGGSVTTFADINNSPDRRRFLLVRASRGREVLREKLAAAGCTVEEVVVYTNRDIAADSPEVRQIAAKMSAGQIDWITVTSSAIAHWLVRVFGGELRHAKLASISPITTDTLVQLGFRPAAEAKSYTIEGVAAAILEAERDCRDRPH